MLKSCAVPKGPSTIPGEKRPALPTPTGDHPLEYADFEDRIPEGECGACAALIWDRAFFRNLHAPEREGGASLEESLNEGKLEAWQGAEKLRGGYALIRTAKGNQDRWLLVKMDDWEADARCKLTSTQPGSAPRRTHQC